MVPSVNASAEQHRKLVNFYKVNDPQQIPKIPLLLREYTYKLLIPHLKKKYGKVPFDWSEFRNTLVPCSSRNFKLPNCFDRELDPQSWVMADVVISSWEPGAADNNLATQKEFYNDEEARGTA